MKKAVFKLELRDEKMKNKAMKIVSSLPGVDTISMDMTDKKMTVIGDIYPLTIMAKLKKLCGEEIVSIGPANPPGQDKKKKDEPVPPVAEPVTAVACPKGCVIC